MEFRSKMLRHSLQNNLALLLHRSPTDAASALIWRVCTQSPSCNTYEGSYGEGHAIHLALTQLATIRRIPELRRDKSAEMSIFLNKFSYFIGLQGLIFFALQYYTHLHTMFNVHNWKE